MVLPVRMPALSGIMMAIRHAWIDRSDGPGLKTAAKIAVAASATLVAGVAIAGLLLPDSVLRSVTGPLGDKAIGAKHAVNDGISHTLDNTIFSLKSLWWDVSDGGDDNSASRLVVDLPRSLREQFGKNAPESSEAPPPMMKSEEETPTEPTMQAQASSEPPAKTEPAMAPHQAEAKAEPAPAAHAPQPEAAHKPEPAAESMAPPPPPVPTPEPKPAPIPAQKPEPKPEPMPAPKPVAKTATQPAHQLAAKPAPQTARKTPDDGSAEHKQGLAFYKGSGVDKNFRKASEWFNKAAAKGHAGAQYNLGIMAYLGQGTDKDFAVAAKWFREAADQGHAAAQYNLGFLYYEGKGVAKDDLQAYTWIDRAANQGHKKAITARDALAKALPKDIFKSK